MTGSLYRAVLEVQANGHLKGWLADQENDQLVWFPERRKRKGAKKGPSARGKRQD